jgi:hypothetical protein
MMNEIDEREPLTRRSKLARNLPRAHGQAERALSLRRCHPCFCTRLPSPRPRKPARPILGDPMPEELKLLPRAELLQRCTDAGGRDTPDPDLLFDAGADAPGEWRCASCGRRNDNILVECVDCGDPQPDLDPDGGEAP